MLKLEGFCKGAHGASAGAGVGPLWWPEFADRQNLVLAEAPLAVFTKIVTAPQRRADFWNLSLVEAP